MATKIKLMRLGKIRTPHYRVVVADARTKRDGKVIETIGKYHPKEDPSFIEIDSERAQYWIKVGAQPTAPVLALLKLTGDYQTAKGTPTESTVKVAAPKEDKRARYDAEAATALERRAEETKAAEAKKAEKKAKKAEAKKEKAEEADAAAATEAKADNAETTEK
ncbi:MAG: 30S ribosomal protein S16 [Corynebacteriales bacterium]|nr:30S ribosomal protein S16 [Mycobacteriales bacterium]